MVGSKMKNKNNEIKKYYFRKSDNEAILLQHRNCTIQKEVHDAAS